MFVSFWRGLRARVLPFVDPTVLMLFAIGLGLMFIVDPVLVKTIGQWVLPFFAFLAVAIIASWLIFPHINFAEWIDEARKGNVVAGYLFVAIAIFMGATLIAIVIWAKA